MDAIPYRSWEISLAFVQHVKTFRWKALHNSEVLTGSNLLFDYAPSYPNSSGWEWKKTPAKHFLTAPQVLSLWKQQGGTLLGGCSLLTSHSCDSGISLLCPHLMMLSPFPRRLHQHSRGVSALWRCFRAKQAEQTSLPALLSTPRVPVTHIWNTWSAFEVTYQNVSLSDLLAHPSFGRHNCKDDI